MTITHDALDLTVQRISPQGPHLSDLTVQGPSDPVPLDMGSHCTEIPPPTVLISGGY